MSHVVPPCGSISLQSERGREGGREEGGGEGGGKEGRGEEGRGGREGGEGGKGGCDTSGFHA